MPVTQQELLMPWLAVTCQQLWERQQLPPLLLLLEGLLASAAALCAVGQSCCQGSLGAEGTCEGAPLAALAPHHHASS